MKETLLLLSLIFILSCSTGLKTYGPRSTQLRNTNLTDLPPSEPGKCYAKALQPNGTVSDTLGAFSIDESIPSHMLEQIELQPATEKWIKKRADKNCLSSHPDDCIVWCLQKTPAVIVAPSVTIDTSGAAPMKYVTLDLNTSDLSETQNTAWAEVICENKLTKKLMQNLHAALEERGYSAGAIPNSRTPSQELKEALKKYQTDNSIMIGQLSTESLVTLGVY